MNYKKISQACGITIIFLLGILTGQYQTHKTTDKPQIIYESTLSQDSTSMLPSLYPDSVLQKIKFNGTLKCGHMYVYRHASDNHTIVHRYVYEDNKGQYWFKGDNNRYYDDPVHLDQIKDEVIGVKI